MACESDPQGLTTGLSQKRLWRDCEIFLIRQRFHPPMPELTIDQAFQLALQHHKAGRLDEAEPIYRSIIAANPKHSDAIHLLGMTAYQRGQTDLALDLVQRAIALDPNVAVYHNNLGQTLERLGRRTDATAEYRTALKLSPSYPEANNNLANMLERDDRMEEAIAFYKKAIALKPDYAEAYTNLGNVYKEQGLLDEAIACYREGVLRRPTLSLLHSNLLLALHYHSGYTPAALSEEHRQWARRHAAPLASSIIPARNRRDPERRLKIGYVSPDFREHAVARFLLPLLANHDRNRFEIHAYSNVAKPDAVTERFKAQVDGWRDIMWLDDAAAADLIRRDEIDILIDLAAHTGGDRLLVFARKPAPVQVTYLAYCSTTGLDTIDYRLTDPYLDPPGTDLSHYTEKTVRLPETYWCYSPPDAATALEPPAPRTDRGVTFGCLNNFCKVSDAVLRTWGRLLHQVPESELVLHARSGSHRKRVRDRLSSVGIKNKRIRFVGKVPFADYIAAYREIDIGLDPFPFTGGTTTCDALWMGLPVVSLRGQTAVSRGGFSLLSNIGLPELVAQTEDEYVRIAATLARDRPRLARLRRELRPRMLASPLMDTPRFTRNLETAFRTMWRTWCESAPP